MAEKDYSHLTEKTLSSENVFNGELLHVFSDKVVQTSGKICTREYIKHKGAVCILPLDNEGNVYIEHQFRYPLHRTIIELPAGKLDSFNEIPLEAAKRELEEETGLVASKWTSMGTYTPTCAYSDEIIHLYLARNLSQKKQNLDEDEMLDVEKIPFKTLLNMVSSGEVTDGKTQVLVLLTALKQYPGD